MQLKRKACLPGSTPSVIACGDATFPKGTASVVVGKLLIALDTLALRATVCALSVTCGDSSPKGRAKSTAGSFLITLKTLATSLRPWLSLRERLRGRIWRARALCGLAGNFTVTAISRPLGEDGLTRSGKTEGVTAGKAITALEPKTPPASHGAEGV